MMGANIPQGVGGYIIPPTVASAIHTRPARMKSHFLCCDMNLAVFKGLLGLSIRGGLDKITYSFNSDSQVLVWV